MGFLSLLFNFFLNSKLVHYLNKCKVCEHMGFISWWSYWYFTISRLTSFKMFSYPISVNQANISLETLLCGANEESTSPFSPLCFPPWSSGRWGLLSEEPTSPNSGGQIAAELCKIFLHSSVFPVLACWKSEKAVTVKMIMPSDLELMHVHQNLIASKPV